MQSFQNELKDLLANGWIVELGEIGYFSVSLQGPPVMHKKDVRAQSIKIKKYKKMWDKISQMFLIGSLSGIAVLGDVIREYLPVNLILTFGFINVGIMFIFSEEV